jgi:hypothetical protein
MISKKSDINSLDGSGWYLEYVGRLMKTYTQFSLEYIENELPMAFGWALVGYAIENDGFYQFCGIKRIGNGYVKQEVEKLKEQYYDSIKKKE